MSRHHHARPAAATTAAIFTAAALFALPACTRGKKKAPEPSAAAAPEAPAAAAPPAMAAPGDAFERGVLPPSILEGEPRRGGEVVLAVQQEPPSLNTLVDSDLMGAYLTEHRIYQSLVRVDAYDDPGFKWVPELAERWEVSEDGRVYTFHLRAGVKWHDGRSFSSADVIATMDKVMDESTKAAHVRSYYKDLEGYSAPDASTVVFKWKRAYFMTLDVMDDLVIQPAHIIGKLTGAQYNEAATNPINRHPIGTGPWKFERWEANQKLVLARNDAYWGRAPYLDRLVVRFAKDATVRFQLAQRGEADLVARISDEQWPKTAEPVIRERYHRVKTYMPGYSWVGWNQGSKPFLADKRVRRALTLLTDRPGMADKMFGGLPKLTTCHFYYAGPDCDPNIKPLPYDPAQAEKLLDEAGWKDTDGDGTRDKDGVPFEFTFMMPASSSSAERITTKMKEDMRRVGVDMAIQKVEWSVFTKRLREHEFDACYLGWGQDARSDPTQIWHSSEKNGGSNYVQFDNAEADKLIDDARGVLDGDTRSAMYRRLGKILHDEQPYTWLWVSAELSLVSRRVKGVRATLFWWQFDDWWVQDAPN